MKPEITTPEEAWELMQAPPPATDAPALWNRSFIGLLVAQFFGATNDNIFRWLVCGIGKQMVGPENEAFVLSLGLAMLILPFVLFAAPAGWLSDRFPKRTILIGAKFLEIVLMSLGALAILSGNIYYLFAVLFLMGTQSTMFSPARDSSLPELVAPRDLPAANATMGMIVIVAAVLGGLIGNWLTDYTHPLGTNHWWLSASVIIGTAIVGTLASLTMRRLPAANPTAPLPWNLIGETIHHFRSLASNRSLLRAAIGSSCFWTLAALTQVNVDSYGIRLLGLSQADIGVLAGAPAVGIALGSILAGLWSAGRIELGMVPVAAAGMACSALLLFGVDDLPAGYPYPLTAACLVMLGTFGGLFTVPINSYLQQQSPCNERGSILAAVNLLTSAGTLAASAIFALLRAPVRADGGPLLAPDQIFLVAGLATLPLAVYAFFVVPLAVIRFVSWLVTRPWYPVRTIGMEHFPMQGPALFLPNHVSMLDGLLLFITTPRHIRMVVFSDYMENPLLNWAGRIAGSIGIKPGNRRSVVEALKTVREALQKGELVCVFPEGALSRSGQLQGFQSGFLGFLRDTNAPVIPVYLEGLWRSNFSYERGTSIWHWPHRFRRPVTMIFGPPVSQVRDEHHARRLVQELGTVAQEERKAMPLTLPRQFVRMCRRRLFHEKVADSTGQKLTGASLLLRTLILRRLLLRDVLAPDEKHVGVLLPPSAPAVLVNAALPLCQRVSVNLNYTVTAEVMNHCIREAGIRHVLTSRRVMEKLNVTLDAELVYLEDFKARVTLVDKLAAACLAFLLPAPLLDRWLGTHRLTPDDVQTIIFTSGSTGEPKGVMLTYHNIGTNVQAIDDLVHLRPDDVLLGILPFFHSFGYTVTIWTVLSLALKGAYHFSPLDAQQVGSLCKKNSGTILLATPTFLRNYLRRCTPDDLKTLNVVVAGAEKLPVDLCAAFEEKFGVRPVEGYGITECSPLVSVNIPAGRSVMTDMVVAKEGTVGRVIPGCATRIVNPETFENLGINEPGMLLIKGPNVMRGYLNHPEKTAQVIRDGWYVTGDIAMIDADGFITITGRQSRFSKIGGEMVPHLKIEETIQQVLGAGEEEMKACVTAVPDPRRGERIIVLHTQVDQTPEQICRRLAEAGLPNLWIPGTDSFLQVEQIPVLGTGKLDLKGMRETALERLGITEA